MNNFKKLLMLLKSNVIIFTFAVVSVIVYTISAMTIPLVIRYTIDTVLNKDAISSGIFGNIIGKSLLFSSIFILLLSLIRGVFLYLKGYLTALGSERISKNLKDSMVKKLQNTKFENYSKFETGDLIQRSTSDIETVRKFLTNQLIEIFGIVLMIVIILIMMISLNVKLTFIALSLIPFIFISSLWFFFNVKKKFQITDESEAKLTTMIQENLNGVKVVKAFSMEKEENEKFSQSNNDFKDKVYKLILNFAYFWSVSDLLAFMQLGLLLSAGIVFATKGEISIGTLVAFTTYEGMLMMPIRSLGRVLSELGKTMVSVSRIYEILNLEEETEDDGYLEEDIIGDIEFRNVTFGYTKDVKVLKNLSFVVKSGESIGIIGPTGCGKSTMMYLLTRLYDNYEGQIIVNGKDVKTFKKHHLRRNIGLILQDPFMFSRTIKENIKIKNQDISDEDLYNSTHVAHLHHNIMEFDRKYETMVGEKGVSLSGGQRQRLAISRMIINKMPVIIFDDSLSAVDTNTDKGIREELKRNSMGTTTFIISHRISTLSETDRILVMDKGCIQDFDTHENLVKKEGIYKRIWEIQSSI
jgi:ATP-binding cassette subfamily B protein